MRNLTNKVAVVTGAGSGIGRALAQNLAKQGALLALSDVNAETVAETADMVKADAAEVVPYTLDVADRGAVLAHADEVVRHFGRVNLVINNAGVGLGADVLDMSWEDLDWLMGINFWGVVHGTKAFLPHLIESGDGHLVNVSSAFGFMGIPTQSAYNAAKFAVRGFTESLHQEMRIGRHPVGVTCVHPGGVRTNIARNARGVEAIADRDTVADAFERMVRTSPESAAATILKGVRRNRARVLIGLDARAMDLQPRILGSSYLAINSAFFKAGFGALEKRGIKS